MANVISEIFVERARQIEREDWSLEHDDLHIDGELALAASAYCINAACLANPNQEPFTDDDPPEMWPFDKRFWKPKTARRDLIRAAALIVAEIQRIDRIAER